MSTKPVQGQTRDESYHQIPAYKYVFIANMAIHKDFFMYWTLFTIIGTSTFIYLTFYTPFWAIVADKGWQFFMVQYWYFTLPALLILSVIGYYSLKHRKKH